MPEDMERFRIDVGHVNDIKPGNIVGAIANEADLDSQYIGHIKIHDEYSTVDLPKGMPKETLDILRKARVAGRPMNLRRLDDKDSSAGSSDRKGTERSEHRKSSFKKDYSDKKPYVKKSGKDDSARSSPFKRDSYKKEGAEKSSFKKADFKKSPYKKKPRSGD